MCKTSNKYYTFFICLVLALTTLAVFWQVHHHEFINFDDNLYIFDNSQVKAGLTREGLVWAFTKIHAHNWHPLTWISHMLDCEFYGLEPGGHHFTNVLLHIANTLLLLLVLKRMTGSLYSSAFVAAAFALHPLHVESVAWASERKDVLSTFFWMLTMWAYIGYAERPDVRRYLLVILALCLGLMAKQMLVTLPLVLLLLDYWPLGRLTFKRQSFCNSTPRRFAPTASFCKAKTMGAARLVSARRCILEKLPLLILSAAASAIVYLIQQRTGTVKSFIEYPLFCRVGNALVAYIAYIGKMLWPSHLAIFYPHPHNDLPSWQIMGAAFLLACITTAVIWEIRQKPYLAVGWLWFLGTLVPVIGLVQVGLQGYADRYTYMTLTGLFIIIAWGIPDLLAKLRYQKVILSLSAAVLPLALGVTAWHQVGHWRNNITLYKHATAAVRNNWWAYFRLGMALDQQNNLDEAIKHYTKALRIKPGFPAAHRNLGYALARQGKLDEALEQYIEALRFRPNFADVHRKLGKVLLQQSRLDEAIKHFTEALRIEPDSVDAHSDLGYALAHQGKLDEAIEHYTKSLQSKPDWTEVRNNLNKLTQRKKRDETIAQYIKMLQRNPDDPDTHDKLAREFYLQGKNDEAILHWTEAVRLKPDWAEAHSSLATAFYRQGNIEQAIKHWVEAVDLKPDWAEVLNNLAWALATTEDEKLLNPPEAIRLAERACELTDYEQPGMLDTLGVAYAAAGRFLKAIETAEKAIKLAEATGKKNLAQKIQDRLQLYKAHRPYREK